MLRIILVAVLIALALAPAHARDKKGNSLKDAQSDIEAAKSLPDYKPPAPSAPARPCVPEKQQEDAAAWRDICSLLGDADAADSIFAKLKADAKKLGVRIENLVPGWAAAYRAIRARPCTHKIRPNVRFSPKATELVLRNEPSRCAISRTFALQQISYSITASARCWRNQGTSRPSAFAVLRLMRSSNFVGCSTGNSPGLAPFNILST
jgi:hypothetical protein